VSRRRLGAGPSCGHIRQAVDTVQREIDATWTEDPFRRLLHFLSASRMRRVGAKGQHMPEINAAAGAVTIPIWTVGAAAAVFLVLTMLAIARVGTAAVMNALFRTAIMIAVVSADWLFLRHMEEQEHAAARRALDERQAMLLVRALAPGSALSCLNELAGEAVEAPCEKAVFGSPEAMSSAVSYITVELALLIDGLDYARSVDPAYGAELAPMRTALQLDRFGIVAHVLAGRGCTEEKCDLANLFSDPSRLLANLQDRAFDSRVAKFAAVWNARSHAGDAGAVPPARPTTMVSPQYDFPSSSSIPPISIMAPEPGQRRGTATNGQAPTALQQVTIPMPPRRPQPARAALPTVPSPAAPAAPAAVGDAPARQ
jgi:hypothetical protein